MADIIHKRFGARIMNTVIYASASAYASLTVNSSVLEIAEKSPLFPTKRKNIIYIIFTNEISCQFYVLALCDKKK